MRILDIDLDFFLNDAPCYPTAARLDACYVPWDAGAVRRFLEEQCGLSLQHRVPGKFVLEHHEALGVWNEWVNEGFLRTPFEIVHVDSHADLGMSIGDPGYLYMMTELLAARPDQCSHADEQWINEGNYLVFAIARSWVSELTYVCHTKSGDDLPRVFFKDNDPDTGFLELKQFTNEQIANWSRNRPPQPLAFGPQVPFRRVKCAEYSNSGPFSFAILCHSKRYTPPESDGLVPLIMEYIEPISSM